MKKEPPWSLKITKAVNGYVVSHMQALGDSDDTYRATHIAIEENAIGDEAECAKRLLLEVLEHFGVYKGIRIELDNEEEEL